MEIKIKGIDEVIYYEKLDNGLDVYLYNKDDFHNNYVTFTTRFGSIYNEFTYEDEKVKLLPGVAHFLEHKAFEMPSGEVVSDFFASNGAISNAYTTFKNTTYLFQGTGNLKENIAYLLDFVQTPYFTSENIEKEKGIITQEINMCDDRPFDILYEEIRKSVFHKSSFKNSIIGTEEEIRSIDKETLDKCYEAFYHPSNMFLVVTGSFDKKDILQLIRLNQSKKTFKVSPHIKFSDKKEPDSVVYEKKEIIYDTSPSKASYNIKIPYRVLDIPKRLFNIYIYIIFNLLFGDSSIFDYEMKQKAIITTSLNYNMLSTDNHIVVSLINETDNYDVLFEEIEHTLSNITINKRDLDRKKRVLISNEVFSYENISLVNEMIVDNIIFEDKLEENIIDMINSIDIDTLNKLIETIDFTNKSIVILGKNNNN